MGRARRESEAEATRPVRKKLRAVLVAVGTCLLLLGAGAGGAQASGATLYVDRGSASCSDGGSGSQAQPFCTIGGAANAVTAGQTVQVASGTYPESVTVRSSGTSASPIVFTAAPGAAVALSGQSVGFTMSGRSWITVSGFTITDTSSFGIYAINSSNLTISGNHISDAGQPVSGGTAPGMRNHRLAHRREYRRPQHVRRNRAERGLDPQRGARQHDVRQRERLHAARARDSHVPGGRQHNRPKHHV